MPKNILIIDDDRLVVKSLAKLITSQGYNVAYAQSGKEALGFIEECDFDLIISDIRMPQMNGFETIRNIKSTQEKKNKPQTPVIFITGYSDSITPDEAKKLNTVDFIYKPFDKDSFLNSIRNIIGG